MKSTSSQTPTTIRLLRLAFLAALFLQVTNPAAAQAQTPAQTSAQTAQAITASTPMDQTIAPLLYLASDRLKGRFAGRSEADTAAQYIANEFHAASAKTLPGTPTYFQLFTKHFNANALDSGSAQTDMKLRNVLAYIPGTDPALKDQYILLSSHYDHLGVTSHPVIEEGKLDSIYNGARDNASGTAAVIDAARYFGKHPAKRSILLICYTAEEEGLIGSEWYAEHPVLALNKVVYNLNIDNASYDDTTLLTLVGLGRTSEDSIIIAAAKTYNFTVNNDPTGGQLFFESDNAPLATHGIPAPTYSMGMRAMDSTIFNRYHRLSDETGNMDMNYVLRWVRTYILAADWIANQPTQPTWTKGDQYEKAWHTLYGK